MAQACFNAELVDGKYTCPSCGANEFTALRRIYHLFNCPNKYRPYCQDPREQANVPLPRQVADAPPIPRIAKRNINIISVPPETPTTGGRRKFKKRTSKRRSNKKRITTRKH